MYRDFLAEAATIVGDDNLRLAHQQYAEIAPMWTEVSHQLAAADFLSRKRASAILTELAERERQAMQILAA